MLARTLSVPSMTMRVRPVTWPAETLALGVILVSAAFMRLVHLGNTSGDLDEGIRGIQLLLMSAGYRPVQEIYSSQGPLLLDMLYPLYQFFGETLGAARIAVGFYSLFGIVGVYWAARVLGGPVGGVVAAVLVTLSPTYLRNSRQALAEVPALAPAILAVAAALMYQRSGRQGWLVLAGLLLGVALLIKPIVLAAVPVVALAALLGPRRGSGPLLLVGAVSAAVVAGVVLTTGFSTVVNQMVDFRLKAREVEGWNLRENVALLRTSLLARDGVGLFALAAAGGLAALLSSPRRALPYVAWPLAALAVLLAYAPLFPKHVVTLVPPAAVLAGAGLGLAWQAVNRRQWQGGLGAFAFVAPLLLYTWSLPTVLRWDVDFMNLLPSTEGERFAQSADVAATISAVTTRGDFLVTDHPYLAFLAQRLVPPELADPSKTRVRARELTGDMIVAAGQEYDTRMVVLWTDRLRPLKTFRDWLDDEFVPFKVYSRGGDSPGVLYLQKDADLARARQDLAGFIGTPTAVDFGGILRLTGFALDRQELGRDGNVGVTYEWEALGRASVDYHVITELRGPDGQSWSDEELSLGSRAIGLVDWTPGQWLLQTSTFEVPPAAPAGEYAVVVGVYDSKAKTDLPITAGDPRLGSSADPLHRYEVARIQVR
ncbi:MAG: glycosyltransferase family 39 protein [Chloroflexota bacterium]|nr:glycosyltransferase family 39 protein [Chloroflexota bacterium]